MPSVDQNKLPTFSVDSVKDWGFAPEGGWPQAGKGAPVSAKPSLWWEPDFSALSVSVLSGRF